MNPGRQREQLERAAAGRYDLVVVGGGIYGAVAAREAALNGLKVALLEKEDFGGATSANSTKIVHGGLRYLQHADLARMRQSIRERTILMRLAPHLVEVQPFLMPVYGHGLKGIEMLRAGLLANDLISLDRVWKAAAGKRIPPGRVLSRRGCLRMVPGLPDAGLTGGAIWYDGLIGDTERLTLAFVRSAQGLGAHVFNYTAVTGFVVRNSRVTGVRVVDQTTGWPFTLTTRMTLNAAGPWMNTVLDLLPGSVRRERVPLSRVFCLVTRPIFNDFALGLSTRAMYTDRDALVDKRSNLIFVIPWQGCALVGSRHAPGRRAAPKVHISETEIDLLLNAVNRAYPPARLVRSDVRAVLAGLLPADRPGSAAPLKHHRIIDHARQDGIRGIVSVVGVKYTTARHVMARAVGLVLSKLERPEVPRRSANEPLIGGHTGDFKRFCAGMSIRPPAPLGGQGMDRLLRAYGSEVDQVLNLVRGQPEWGLPVADDLPVVSAQVIRAVTHEMAIHLADVVFRRTGLGSRGYPGHAAIEHCALLMAPLLGWSPDRCEWEMAHTHECFGRMGALPPVTGPGVAEE